MHLLLRVFAILTGPAAEWERIAQEDDDPISLLFRYVAPLAAIPPVFRFVGACIIGVIVPGGRAVRAPMLEGIFGSIFGYLASFVLVLLLASIVSIAAPLFGSRRNFLNACKLTVYSYTPVWLAGVFLILPGLRFLVLTGFYGACLLVIGLPLLLKPAKERVSGFAALIIVFACMLTFIAAAAQSVLFGTPGL
jgi:hypothetical protein